LNRKIFESFMHTEPKSTEERYLFVVDNADLALNILGAGFRSVAILEDWEGFFSFEEFRDYLGSTELLGSCRMDHIYVSACGTKKKNQQLDKFFEEECLTHREGWRIFFGKDYLTRIDALELVGKELRHFINSMVIPPSEEPDLDAFHTMNKDGEPASPLDIAIVEQVMEKNDFFVLGVTPFLYDHGVYQEDRGGARLKEEIRKLMYRKFMRSNTINRIYALLISRPEVQKDFRDLYNFPPYWVNFRNGFYDSIRQVMIPHNPQYLSVNQVPFTYDPDNKAESLSGGEAIRKYLAVSLPDEAEQRMFWEYAGYCMTADTQMQKFLILTGNGGTGKSVMISLIESLVGIGNCSCISLQDLNKRFYATGLFGKLLNACGDIPCKAMESTDVVKKAVGEDALLFEKKGEDAVQFRSHAKLLFSCNGLPENLDDKTDAFYRRLLVLEMDHVVTEEEKDTGLKEKISAETGYAVCMAMEALHGLYERGSFIESERSRKCVDNLRRMSDSTWAFVSDTLVRKPGSRVDKSRMYTLYEKYCEENGRMPLGKEKFNEQMIRKGFVARKHQGIFRYKDTAIREEEFEEMPEDMATPFDSGAA